SGARAAYVTGDLGPAAQGDAEVRVIDLATREMETVHVFEGSAVQVGPDTGPESGDPVFWWYDDSRLAVYQPADGEWLIVHVDTGEPGTLAFRSFGDHEQGATWQIIDSVTGDIDEHPAGQGLPR